MTEGTDEPDAEDGWPATHYRVQVNEDDQTAAVEFPIDHDGWFAYAFVVIQDGTPILAELRLFPGLDRWAARGKGSSDRLPPLGEWKPTPLPGVRNVPEAGITPALLRTISLPEIGFLINFAVGFPAASDDGPDPGFVDALSKLVDKRPGPVGRADVYYARWAQRYVDVCEDPDTSGKPILTLARRHGCSEAHVRDAIHTARQRKLLTRSGQGRPGGELTAKALELLGLGPP